MRQFRFSRSSNTKFDSLCYNPGNVTIIKRAWLRSKVASDLNRFNEIDFPGIEYFILSKQNGRIAFLHEPSRKCNVHIIPCQENDGVFVRMMTHHGSEHRM